MFNPSFIWNIVSFITLIIAGGIFLFSSVRKNDLKVLRDANQDLRDSINDKQKKIDELTIKVDILDKKVAVLEAQNSDLQILVKEALVVYFTRFPDVARTMQDKNT